MGEDRGGDTEGLFLQRPGAQPGGTERPSEADSRVQNEAVQTRAPVWGWGWTPARWVVVGGPLGSFSRLGVTAAGPLGLTSRGLSQAAPGEENGERLGETGIGTS